MIEQRDLSFIYKYFTGEKQESLLFLLLGIVAVSLALVFYFFIKTNPALYKGAVVPLFAIGLIQCVVGFTVYSRSDKQMADVAYHMGMDPVNYSKQTELPRMKKVMKNFVVYRWVEIAFIITGLGLVFLFKGDTLKSFWYGFGMALAIQAAIMLAADYFAESRGEQYTTELGKIVNS